MKDSIGIDTEFFICACNSDEHTLKFTYIEDPDYNEIYVSTFLRSDFSEMPYPDSCDLPWFIFNFLDRFVFVPFKRLKTAIGYLFSAKEKYGHFDCFILKPEDCDRMIDFLNKLKVAEEKRRQKFQEIREENVVDFTQDY
jgi:hypothetical protein